MDKKKSASVKKGAKKIPEDNGMIEKFKLNFSTKEASMEELLKAGAHFGHSKSRRDPRMEKYIFGSKKGINIIDLEQTKIELGRAVEFIKKLIAEEKKILFVGTKKQAKAMIKDIALSCDMPFVSERWLGGTFTNFGVIKKRAQYLRESQEKMATGGFDKYTKLERLKKTEELEKLEKKMGGIKNMTEFPGAIFISDIKTDEIALKEALKAGIPVIAIVDTNVNPENIDYPIPANDDAVSSVKIILEHIGGIILKK
ncbi:MAG: 30S ribosomal protein S2 [Candidatus Moranbacteria bacterium]|jgi:small subunit ribosomal protein S2|nr:30S ribosomal protein S2 [Candidatus Moranbacteria bacterium]MDD5652001.1 30S ribosomal protein S2 [Candidatus Moranbacteria bacterium]MDX9855874.1 30S ribosomal protein S2 [Candidatus Moranbacteria bacterium]